MKVEYEGKKIDLLPCPFCGGTPKIHSFKRNGWWYRVRCVGDCPVHPETYTYRSLEEVCAIWNHRQKPEESAHE